MKGICLSVRLIYTFILLSIFLIKTSISKSILNKKVLDQDQCKKLDFDVSQSYAYITDEYRYKLCKEKFADFDQKLYMNNAHECLGPNCNYEAHLNPCAIQCPMPYSPIIQTFRVYNRTNPELDFLRRMAKECKPNEKCKEFQKSYKNEEVNIIDTSQQCGPKHFCDSNGCCVERVMTTTIAKSTINTQTPTYADIKSTTNSITSKNTTFATKAISSTPITTTSTSTTTPTPMPAPTTTKAATTTTSIPTTPTTLTTPTTSSTPTTLNLTINTSFQTPITSTQITTTERSIPFVCTSVGVFKDPNDITNRKYIKCVLKPEHKECPNKQIFDRLAKHCVSPVTTTVPTTSKSPTTLTYRTTTQDIDWKKYFNCTEEGFYRNPYNCSKFYRCYKNVPTDPKFYIAFFDCALNQWFDDKVNDTCIPIRDYISRFGTCTVKSLPTFATTLPTVPTNFDVLDPL